MKLATIHHQSRPVLAAQVPGGVATLQDLYDAASLGKAPSSMQELLEAGPSELQKIRSAIDSAGSKVKAMKEQDVSWLAPQPRAGKILGVAVNNSHLNKMAFREPPAPMIFMKASSSLTGHNKPVEIMTEHGYTIPEPELVAVLGKGGKNIPESSALSHVFGYTITNDITASGVKFTMDSVALNIGAKNMKPHHTVWREKMGPDDGFLYFTYHTRSKSSDTFAPMGPWLTPAEDVPNPDTLAVRSWINDQLYTDDSTANYLFSVAKCISEASRFLTLEAGDIIHFGTAGAGNEKFPTGNRSVNLFEMDGSTCDVEIEGLGRLSNPIKRV